MKTITINIEISDDTCADIMCTALEGGIGYWCVADDIRYVGGDSEYLSFVALDDNDADAEPFGKVTYDTIRIGIERILLDRVKIRRDLRNQVLSVTNPDRTDIDADAADCIVQAGLFNDVVYG